MKTAFPAGPIASPGISAICAPKLGGPCLLDIVSPILVRAEQPSVTTGSSSYDLASPPPSWRGTSLQEPLPKTLHDLTTSIRENCDRKVTRCPLYAIMLGGALAGGARLLHDVTHYYEQIFFTRWMPRMTDEVASALNAIALGRDAECFLLRLGTGVELAVALQDELKTFAYALTTAVESLKVNGQMNEEVAAHWNRTLLDTRGLVHDANNIVGSYRMASAFMNMHQDMNQTRELLRSLQNSDFSSVASAATFIAKMNKSRAESRQISIDVAPMPQIAIPLKQRITLFRIIGELVVNGCKFTDPDKTDRHITIAADVHDAFVRVHVSDNGVGIHDLAAVFQSFENGNGLRERPDLASGDGSGLGSIARRAREENWGFYLVSAPGVGTDAGVYINIADLENFVPQGNDSPHRRRKSSRPPPATGTASAPSPSTPNLAAVIVDVGSLIKTKQLWQGAITRYDYFPKTKTPSAR